MKAKQRFISGVIFRAKRGCRYPEAGRGFNCFVPVATRDWAVCDCWVTDEAGNVDPGLSCSPVPVQAKDLGMAIGRRPCAHCGWED